MNHHIAVMKQALEALENALSDDKPYIRKSEAAITSLRTAIEAAEKQEPVKFLANGTRFKAAEYPHGVCIKGLPKELAGRWVALVAAEDDCHMKLTTPPAAPVQEPVACNCTNPWAHDQCTEAAGCKIKAKLTTPPAAPVQEPVNQRAHEMALRQWEHWKQYALELQEKLVKYEGGAPMVLNTTAAPVQEPSRTQTKQIVDGLQRCHHPDSQHEFLRTWIRDWTIHKTAQRQWVGLTDEELRHLRKCNQQHDAFARAIEAKLKEKNT